MFLSVVDEKPDEQSVAEALFYLGYTYSLLNENREAVDVWRQIIQNYPTDEYALMARLCLGKLTSRDVQEK